MTTDYTALARSLTDSLRLEVAPIAVCLTDRVPAGVPVFAGRAPAGCLFWQEAAKGDVEAGASPTVKQSLERLSTR